MKLTNYVRDAFIRAAMADVPKVDYEDQALKLVTAEFRALFDKTFSGLDRDALTNARWIVHRQYRTPQGLRNTAEYGPDDYDYIQYKMPALWTQLTKLGVKHSEQQGALNSLESKLRTITYGCSTRKALAAALPEFEKYLPPETATTRSLPVVANVVADFVKAGWPKQGAAA